MDYPMSQKTGHVSLSPNIDRFSKFFRRRLSSDFFFFDVVIYVLVGYYIFVIDSDVSFFCSLCCFISINKI